MLKVADLPVEGEGGLLDMLTEVVDPRMRRGVRHRVEVVLAFALCAMLAGARSLAAIAQWSSDQPAQVVRRLRAERFGAPSEPTFRRVLGAVDPVAFGRQVGAWFARLTPAAGVHIQSRGVTPP